MNNTLVEKLVENYWTQPSSLQHFNPHIQSFELDSTVLPDTYDEFESESLNAYSSMQHSPLPVCKPFGIELLANRYSLADSFIPNWSQEVSMILSTLLANMPRIQDDDFQQNIDLLLGPPTVESVQYMVEVGVYLTSNNMNTNYVENFIESMLRIVPWTVLKSILSTPIPTIQTFEESVFQVATSMGNVRVVKDLLQNPRLNCLLRSPEKILIEAVQSSNAELVRLILHAGARPNTIPKAEWDFRVPLVEAKTVEIARILVEAGADVNAKGYYPGWPGHEGHYTALCLAGRKHDVKLVRYLISAGANVNLPSCTSSGTPLNQPPLLHGTPLEMAARFNQRELLKLLLEHGAHVNRVQEKMGPLQHAAISGDLDCVRLLIDAGADVNAPAYHPYETTALQAASFQNHLKMVTFLLDSGANVNAPGTFDPRFQRLYSLPQWKKII